MNNKKTVVIRNMLTTPSYLAKLSKQITSGLTSIKQDKTNKK